LLNVIFSKSQKYAFLYCTVRKKYLDVEDLKNEVHYNIAVQWQGTQSIMSSLASERTQNIQISNLLSSYSLLL